MNLERGISRCAVRLLLFSGILSAAWHTRHLWWALLTDPEMRLTARVLWHNEKYTMRLNLVRSAIAGGVPEAEAHALCAGLLPEAPHPDTPAPDTFLQNGVGQA